MTTSPKEKAKELVDKFKQHSYYDGHDMTTRHQRERSNVESAVECALIAVDEIIGVLDEISIGESGTTKIDYGQSFYQSVKEAINQL